jgi:glycosyltransferase involved in cell wall biosynthesis
MRSRKIKFHQVGPGSAVRDGAVDTMLLIGQMLAELGFASEIFIDGSESSWPSPLRRASELRPRAHDMLLIHHRGCQHRLDWLAGLHCRKALVYHGIAPPRSFARDSGEYHLSVKAYAQLATLRGIAEASIALSSSSSSAGELRQRGFAHVTTMPFAKDWTGLRLLDPVNPVDPNRLPGFRIVNIGEIARYNRQRELVGFIDQARSIGTTQFELTLIGTGEPDRGYRAQVEDDIRRLSLGDRVAVIDKVSPNELAG